MKTNFFSSIALVSILFVGAVSTRIISQPGPFICCCPNTQTITALPFVISASNTTYCVQPANLPFASGSTGGQIILLPVQV